MTLSDKLFTKTMTLSDKLFTRWLYLLFMVIGILYLLGCLDLINVHIDDVFITLRYGRNVLDGNGPVFNRGEAVEGYSNPTWLFLLTALGSVTGLTHHFELYYLSKGLCVVFGLLTLVTFYRLAKLRGNEMPVIIFLLLTIAISPFLNTYNISGMETSLVTFLLALTLLLYFLWEERRTRGYALGFAIILGLLSISRPEAVIYPVAIYAGLFIVRMLKKSDPLPNFYLALAVVCAIFAAFIGFRLSYYGEFVPNTLYAKNSPGFSTFASGAHYVLVFLGIAVIPYAFVALLKKTPLLLRAYMPIYLVIIAQFAFVVYAGGDWMPSFRLLLPTLPLILFVLMDQVDVSALTKEKVVASLAAIILITGCSWVLERDYNKKNFQGYVTTGLRLEFQTYDANYYDIAQALAKISVPNESVLIGEAGFIPYLNDKLYFNDLFGLMDKHIAQDVRGTLTRRVDNDYFFARNYDYVVAITQADRWTETAGKYHTGYLVVDSFINDPRFNQTYTPVYQQKRGVIFKRIEPGRIGVADFKISR